MPTIDLTPEDLYVRLSPTEKFGALSGDLRVSRHAISAAEPIEDPLRAVRGLRSPGLSLPGRVKAGAWRSRKGREFVAVRRGQRGVRLHLRGHKYASVLVSTENPDRLVAALASTRS